MDRVSGCLSCDGNELTDRPFREQILVTEFWRLAHAFGTPIPGWLVLLPLRHVTSVSELNSGESAELGGLLAASSRAVEVVTRCRKTYLAMFAEKGGFAHVHFHLVPRAADLPPELRGPRVFELLGGPADEWVSDDEADRISGEIRRELSNG
jgi:diadenosine tetraphosphate (Ap4A) HIT family hydrolase